MRGLLQALPPEFASKHLDPQTQQLVLECQGFNHKNHYTRRTPTNPDTLREYVRDVPAAQWMDWFSRSMQAVFQRYGFCDPAGIFVRDASYLFVPDYAAYDGSVVMWFDEHNHPADYAKFNAAQGLKAHRERCYKLVTLLHLRRGCYVFTGLALPPGHAHECPVLNQLVEQFNRQVGPGMLKWLILNRGFVDGPNITRCKTQREIEVPLPMKQNTDI